MSFNIINFFIISFLTKLIASNSIVPRSSIKSDEQMKLETVLVSAVFRHGDRAPDLNKQERFPTDPYLNYSFEPEGYGGLINRGKLREYTLGIYLRNRYDKFLGPYYTPDKLMAISTDYERTRMSLILVLAGLFPPKDEQVWNPNLNWQPVPVTFIPYEKDSLLISEACEQYITELRRVLNLPEVRAKIDKFRPLMNYLTHWAGKKFSTTNDMYDLYHTLMAEQSMGLALPSWTYGIFPHGQLYDATILDYTITNYNDKLRRLFGGILLRNITDTMVNIAKNTNNNYKVKINLFSGHETNVASLLFALGVYTPHVPSFGSAVIVELLKNQFNKYYVTLDHYWSIPFKVEKLIIPGCERYCPLEKFITLLTNVIPSDEEQNCPMMKIL